MSRRRFLKESALIGAAAMVGGLEGPPVLGAPSQASGNATKRPIRILMGGYGPATTGFSLALKRIGDRL